MELNREVLEKIVREVVLQSMGQDKQATTDHLMSVNLPAWEVTEADRLDTGNPMDQVYTKDFFTLKESPRLGAGLMVMKETTFDWHLEYDEIDYVIDGHLEVVGKNGTVKADKGQIILIPKGSSIKFSVPDYARFMYVTYPADWENQ